MDSDLSKLMDCTPAVAIFENEEVITPAPILKKDETPLYVITLGVFFALVGMALVGLAMLQLFRM